jgi:hypothetical protein
MFCVGPVMGVGGIQLALVPMVLVGDTPVRESLHTSRDKGSKGFPGLAWLYWQQKIRGVLVADLYHEDWNGLKRAAVSAGVWLPILERVLIRNLPHGPWQGHAFHGSIKAHAAHLRTAGNTDDPVFQFLFERLAFDVGAVSLQFGSTSHLEEVFRVALSAAPLSSLGHKVRIGRWYSIFNACKNAPDVDSALLWVLVNIGVNEHYWPDLPSSPLGNARAAFTSGAGLEPQPVAGAAASFAGTVKSSNQELNKVRADSKNNVDLVARLLSNVVNCRIFEAVRCHGWQLSPTTQPGKGGEASRGGARGCGGCVVRVPRKAILAQPPASTGFLL